MLPLLALPVPSFLRCKKEPPRDAEVPRLGSNGANRAAEVREDKVRAATGGADADAAKASECGSLGECGRE